MYVHIGGETVVRSDEIIAIFDLSISDTSKVSQQFISQAEQQAQLVKVSDEPAKSIVIVKDKVYYSPISSSTLKRRSKQMHASEVFV
jgi:hypothetical protein